MSNAEDQKRFREKMKEESRKRVCVWVKRENADEVREKMKRVVQDVEQK